ncbi:hypothetical protein Hanom_Chr08g00715541 [Helianthus anomalus]
MGNVRDNNYDVGDDSDPKVDRVPEFISCGTKEINNKDLSRIKDCFFFKSAENIDMPKGKAGRIRPRYKNSNQMGNSSPNSDIRPRKRSMDKGQFNFHLTLTNMLVMGIWNSRRTCLPNPTRSIRGVRQT